MIKHRKLLGIVGASTILGIAAFDCYRCVKALRKPLSTNFMNRKSEFIFIKVRLRGDFV